MPHIHELYDFTVTAFIVYDNKVLLVDHPRYQKWLAPGGHIELDQDPEEALYNEIAEETGLDVEILNKKIDVESPETKFMPTPNYVDVHDANPPHKHISFIYFAKAKSPDFVLSDEHTAMRWISEKELRDPAYNLTPANIFYAQEAIKLSGS